jgi:hypothetical protein
MGKILIQTTLLTAIILSSIVSITVADPLPDYGSVVTKLPNSSELRREAKRDQDLYNRFKSKTNRDLYRVWHLVKLLCEDKTNNKCTHIPATPENVARESATCLRPGYFFSWSPISEAKDGAAHVQRLRQLADQRSVFACKGEQCLAVVRLNSQAGNQKGLAVCQVEKVGESYGAPKYCQQLFVDDGVRQLVRVMAGDFDKLRLSHSFLYLDRQEFGRVGRPHGGVSPPVLL